MSKLIKKLSLALTLTPVAAVAPLVVNSCSKLPEGDLSKEEQTTLLNSEAAKITLLDSWLTTTYTSLYVMNLKPNQTTANKTKIENTIRYYLDNLTWPSSSSGTLVGSDSEVEFADSSIFTNDDKNAFKKIVEDAYKFYISYMSTVTISTSSDSDSTSTPAKLYFKNKALEWKKAKYNMWTPVEVNGRPITINDFNPGLSYTGLNEGGSINENDFKILMLTRGTLIYQNVMKLLLSEMYFLHATEQQIKNGTNFVKMTKKVSSVNYINTMAYVEDGDFSTFLLKKYMVENLPALKWSYSGDDYNVQNQNSGLVSTQVQFNNISTTLDTTLSLSIAPNSNETDANTITNLQAYNSFEINPSSTDDNPLSGDLATDIDSIKQFGAPKIGLLDTNTNILFNFSELDAIKSAIAYNKANNNSLMIPSINVSSSASDKTAHSITIDDLEIKWAGNNSTSVSGKEYSYSQGGVDQKITIDSLTFAPSETKEKTITISFTYSFTVSGTTKSFDYNFQISDWGDENKDQDNIFSKGYILGAGMDTQTSNTTLFATDENQVGIKIFDGSTATGITYYLRALPIFEKYENSNQTGQILIGKNWYMRGQFTLKNTPWNDEATQRNLIYFFMLSDSTLYSKIQDFYLFNDFNIEGQVSEVTSQIQTLGLTKKTSEDRKNAGII